MAESTILDIVIFIGMIIFAVALGLVKYLKAK